MQKATNVMILFNMIRGVTSNISIDKRQTLAIEIFNFYKFELPDKNYPLNT